MRRTRVLVTKRTYHVDALQVQQGASEERSFYLVGQILTDSAEKMEREFGPVAGVNAALYCAVRDGERIEMDDQIEAFGRTWDVVSPPTIRNQGTMAANRAIVPLREVRHANAE
jgi:hypothetical protein